MSGRENAEDQPQMDTDERGWNGANRSGPRPSLAQQSRKDDTFSNFNDASVTETLRADARGPGRFEPSQLYCRPARKPHRKNADREGSPLPVRLFPPPYPHPLILVLP